MVQRQDLDIFGSLKLCKSGCGSSKIDEIAYLEFGKLTKYRKLDNLALTKLGKIKIFAIGSGSNTRFGHIWKSAILQKCFVNL